MPGYYRRILCKRKMSSQGSCFRGTGFPACGRAPPTCAAWHAALTFNSKLLSIVMTLVTMAFSVLNMLFGSTINISGSSFTDVAGNSHTNYGDTYNKNSIHEGSRLRSHHPKSLTSIMNSLSLANNLEPCFDGCYLRFRGARPSFTMS